MKKLSVIAAILLITVMLGQAFAAEGGGAKHWRATYDAVMVWVNFSIMVFIIVRYGGRPIMDFLHGQHDKVAREIKQMEQQKDDVSVKIKETMKSLEDSEVSFADMKKRIIARGEAARQNIIEEAQRQTKIIMEVAKRKIGTQLFDVRDRFKHELVDEAIAIAMNRLPAIVTDDDNQKLLDRYLIAAAH